MATENRIHWVFLKSCCPARDFSKRSVSLLENTNSDEGKHSEALRVRGASNQPSHIAIWLRAIQYDISGTWMAHPAEHCATGAEWWKQVPPLLIFMVSWQWKAHKSLTTDPGLWARLMFPLGKRERKCISTLACSVCLSEAYSLQISWPFHLYDSPLGAMGPQRLPPRITSPSGNE